jgi:hypothetical protein
MASITEDNKCIHSFIYLQRNFRTKYKKINISLIRTSLFTKYHISFYHTGISIKRKSDTEKNISAPQRFRPFIYRYIFFLYFRSKISGTNRSSWVRISSEVPRRLHPNLF